MTNTLFMQALALEGEITEGQLSVTNSFPLEKSYAELMVMREMSKV